MTSGLAFPTYPGPSASFVFSCTHSNERFQTLKFSTESPAESFMQTMVVSRDASGGRSIKISTNKPIEAKFFFFHSPLKDARMNSTGTFLSENVEDIKRLVALVIANNSFSKPDRKKISRFVKNEFNGPKSVKVPAVFSDKTGGKQEGVEGPSSGSESDDSATEYQHPLQSPEELDMLFRYAPY